MVARATRQRDRLRISTTTARHISRSTLPAIITPSPLSTVKSFLTNVQYNRPYYARPYWLEQTLREEILSWNMPDIPNWSRIIVPSCAMAAMSYSGHPPEVQQLIATFTWFMIYIDDQSARGDPEPYACFQQRYLTSQPQLDPVLDRFAIHLRDMYKFYSPFCANAIISASFDFVSGNVLERLTENMEINPRAQNYPYFLRSKTGVAHAYALMIFPVAQHTDLRSFIQAEPTVAYWIDITNDVLSYYKEELAHETGNYVHLRAAVVKRDPLRVVGDLSEEATAAAEAIGATLDGPAKAAWERFLVGYITFHVSQERYKLSDLGMDYQSPATPVV